ncbi:hypothetical protein [Stakelama pacifica]|uniref:Uncharacterized protein n=1 Tax=Stakelama pacifica TaxID=517720 RepID=A0A4R6FS71_9SPHN|nr:hypothetical protein [Stakelama pacifica]TDN83724.1 hypothetical protein EV664_104210 [Stakelama pacifica]GGO94639.1 hypothetical protein GCM10011329_16990 [Stakelama pacifica]
MYRSADMSVPHAADAAAPSLWANNALPSDITGSEAANFVLLELRLGMVSAELVREWVKELRQEGFRRLADAIEARVDLI